MLQDEYCSQSFVGRDISGNTITTKPGQLADCCDICQQTAGCKAYSWANTNGGTCTLKSAMEPMVAASGVQTSVLLPGKPENCTRFWDEKVSNKEMTWYWATTGKYYYLAYNFYNFQDVYDFCTKLGGDIVSIHSQAENDYLLQISQANNNVQFTIGFYAPNGAGCQNCKYAPTKFVWTDGSVVNYTNWTPGDPSNACGNEIAVAFIGGIWYDSDPGPTCWRANTICQFSCGVGGSAFPIDDSCPFDAATRAKLADQMTQPNFNADILTIIMASYPLKLKSNISWSINDVFTYAAFERTELDLEKDLTTWTDNSMGNCFTFNHVNASKIYTMRYKGEHGGIKARVKIHQDQYLEWSYTASLLIFFHQKEQVINGESVSYQIASGEEATFMIRRKDYTRLGPPYGKCINDKSEVKSFYSGGIYNVDSCYQDYVYEICDCMDPRYASKDGVALCGYSKIDCFMNITLIKGEPSTWSTCTYCLPPCQETTFEVSWSKTTFKNKPTECNPMNQTLLSNNQTVYDNCTAQFQEEFSIFTAYMVQHGHYVFAENPKMTFMDIFNSFCNLTGLLLGLAMVSIFEFIYLFIWICYSMSKDKKE